MWKEKKIIDLIFKLEHLFFTLYFSYLLEKKKVSEYNLSIGEKKVSENLIQKLCVQ